MTFYLWGGTEDYPTTGTECHHCMGTDYHHHTGTENAQGGHRRWFLCGHRKAHPIRAPNIITTWTPRIVSMRAPNVITHRAPKDPERHHYGHRLSSPRRHRG